MSRILVTPEMLLHVAEQCSRAHEQLEAMIHMLNQNIHMLESGWEGTTRSRFYADFQQAHREMTQTTEHIHRTSLELRGIAQRFKSADERGQPIQVAGHVLGAFPMMRGPAGHSAVEDAGRKAEEAWNSVQQEAGKAWDTVKQEAGELWEGVKIGAAQLGNSLMDTAISLYEDPLGTGKEMLYNATIGTVEDIWNTGIWAGRMLFSDEYREKIAEDVKAEVDSAGGWSNYLGQQSAMILGGAILNRAGVRGRGPLNNKHDDLGGGNGSGGERGDDGGRPAAVDKGKWLGGLQNTENFKIGTKENGLNHIFDGEVLKSGRANGYHYEGMPNSNGKIVGNVDPPNELGVYQANIEVSGVLKKVKSTFFPKEWSPQQVVDAINEAFTNKEVVKNNVYRGITSQGMEIEFVLRNDKIISAYPLY